MSTSKPSKTVFVGNLPYNATESDLKELFSEVGPVVGFRLPVDKDTGRAKGFGFCEYEDERTAESAIRNLANREFQGRQLRVSPADNEGSSRSAETRTESSSATRREREISAPPAVNTQNQAIQESYEVLLAFKGLLHENFEQGQKLLLQNPPLAEALHRMMTELNRLRPSQQPQIPQRPIDPQPIHAQMPSGPMQIPPQARNEIPPNPRGFFPHRPANSYGPPQTHQPHHMGYPSSNMQPMNPAVAPIAPSPQMMHGFSIHPNDINALRSITQAEIDLLPPEDREVLMKMMRELPFDM